MSVAHGLRVFSQGGGGPRPHQKSRSTGTGKYGESHATPALHERFHHNPPGGSRQSGPVLLLWPHHPLRAPRFCTDPATPPGPPDVRQQQTDEKGELETSQQRHGTDLSCLTG